MVEMRGTECRSRVVLTLSMSLGAHLTLSMSLGGAIPEREGVERQFPPNRKLLVFHPLFIFLFAYQRFYIKRFNKSMFHTTIKMMTRLSLGLGLNVNDFPKREPAIF